MTPAPDLILHIGLAAGREFYTLEKGAHSRGYGAIPDVDEEKFPDHEAEKLWPSKKFPGKLRTGFDTEDVLERWQQELRYASNASEESLPVNGKDSDVGHVSKITKATDARTQEVFRNGHARGHRETPDVRLSANAGNYMCGFIYYNSLAHYYSMDSGHLPVAFLHVPDLSSSKERLDTGREVAVALIRALVESRKQVGILADGSGEGVETVETVDGARVETDVNFAV